MVHAMGTLLLGLLGFYLLGVLIRAAVEILDAIAHGQDRRAANRLRRRRLNDARHLYKWARTQRIVP